MATAPPGDVPAYLREKLLRQRLSRSRHSLTETPGGPSWDVFVCDQHTLPFGPWAYWMAASSPPSSAASRAGRLRTLQAREDHWLAAGSDGRARRSDAPVSPGRALPRQRRPAALATARGLGVGVGSALSPCGDRSDAVQASCSH